MLAALTGLWAVCFVIHLGQVVDGRLAWIPLYVAGAESPQSFPTVRALWPGTDVAGLAPGDAIVSAGGVTLAGAAPLEFVNAVYGRTRPGPVEIERVRGGESARVSLPLVPIEQPWRRSVTAAAFALLGALAFWRTRG